jgi:uncharacterized membrane protein
MGRLILFLLILAGIAYLMPAPIVHHEASAEINAPRERVWQALSDLKGWSRWNEDVDSTGFLTDQQEGVGTKVRLDGKFMSVYEEVTNWEPYNRIDVSVKLKPNLTQDHVMRYTMAPEFDRTTVKIEEEYKMRGGYLGHALDLLFFDHMRDGFRGPALGYLKRLAETGVGMGT